MATEHPLYRKPLPATPTTAPSPNTAFKRKPIPVAVTPPTPINTNVSTRDPQCPHCGAGATPARESQPPSKPNNLTVDAQRRISELEAENKILTDKATAAADRLADYEDELERVKAGRNRTPSPRPPSAEPSVAAGSPLSFQASEKDPEELAEEEDTVSSLPPPPAPQQPRSMSTSAIGRSLTTTRITNFLAARRNSSNTRTSAATSPGSEGGGPLGGGVDLATRLAEAEKARRAAETKLNQTNLELEELSASLFQSANEMVSKERKQNAEREAEAAKKSQEREEQWQKWQKQVKANERATAARTKALEKKVTSLEQRVKLLEEREKEKAKRLERLELAMKRAARVRGLLQSQAQAPAQAVAGLT